MESGRNLMLHPNQFAVLVAGARGAGQAKLKFWRAPR